MTNDNDKWQKWKSQNFWYDFGTKNSDNDRFEAFSSGFSSQVDKVVKVINYDSIMEWTFWPFDTFSILTL